MIRRALLISVVSTLALTSLSACTASRREDLSSRYPVDRARAVVKLAEAGDVSAVHRLVELLDDDDAAVRMYAILALQRLTGQSYGYAYYGSQQQRSEAIQRWRAALRDGRVRVRGGEQMAAPRTAPSVSLVNHTRDTRTP